MTPFTKILVPVDFNPHSAEAVYRAIDIARRYEAELLLLYAYEPADYPLPEGYVVYTTEQLERMTAEIQKRLEAARQQAEAAGAPRVSTRLIQGSAAQVILDLARDERFDLIVMGTHGRTGVGRWVMGSVAEKVVRSASSPVLTVRSPGTSHQP
jgi:nucleotide-binding universal stress UspA family protein